MENFYVILLCLFMALIPGSSGKDKDVFGKELNYHIFKFKCAWSRSNCGDFRFFRVFICSFNTVFLKLCAAKKI
jgi:hypothetical protein